MGIHPDHPRCRIVPNFGVRGGTPGVLPVISFDKIGYRIFELRRVENRVLPFSIQSRWLIIATARAMIHKQNQFCLLSHRHVWPHLLVSLLVPGQQVLAQVVHQVGQYAGQ